MTRKQLLEKAFQRGHLLNLSNRTYKAWIEKFIVEEVQGDVGTKGDITSNALLKKNKEVRAIVKTREKGILAGLEEVMFLYKKNKIKVRPMKQDGDTMKKGDTLLKIKGKEKDILRLERSALDLLQRMSGIATLTRNLLKKTDNKVPIAPTRKTQWRYLDKKAVFVGGGMTHRLALWESILIKDNHLKALKREGIEDIIKTAIDRAWKNKKTANFIEIEVTDTKQAIKAAASFQSYKELPFIIMLDNMSPKKIAATLKKIEQLGLREGIIIEASGGITPSNIKRYSKIDIDVISMGYLTHSSHALDIKQDII